MKTGSHSWTLPKAASGALLAKQFAPIPGLQLQPEPYEAWYNFGNAFLHASDPAEAGRFYEPALAISPDDHPMLYQLGLTRERTGDLPGAASAAGDIVRRVPAASQRHNVGLDFGHAACEALEQLEGQSAS